MFSGTGNILCTEAYDSSHQRFQSAMATADVAVAMIVCSDGTWERTLVTKSSDQNVLTRSTFISSSTGSRVDFSAGTGKVVFMVQPTMWEAMGLMTDKPVTAAGDLLLLSDSADSNNLKSMTRSNWLSGLSLTEQGLVPISKHTITSSLSTVDITSGIDSTYDEYILTMYSLRPSATATLTLQIRVGGAFVTTTTYRYINHSQLSNTPTTITGSGSASASVLNLHGGTVVSTSHVSGWVRMLNPNVSGERKAFLTNFSFGASATTSQGESVGGGVNTTNTGVIDGVRIGWSTGTFNASAVGFIQLYGVQKT